MKNIFSIKHSNKLSIFRKNIYIIYIEMAVVFASSRPTSSTSSFSSLSTTNNEITKEELTLIKEKAKLTPEENPIRIKLRENNDVELFLRDNNNELVFCSSFKEAVRKVNEDFQNDMNSNLMKQFQQSRFYKPGYKLRYVTTDFFNFIKSEREIYKGIFFYWNIPVTMAPETETSKKKLANYLKGGNLNKRRKSKALKTKKQKTKNKKQKTKNKKQKTKKQKNKNKKYYFFTDQ